MNTVDNVNIKIELLLENARKKHNIFLPKDPEMSDFESAELTPMELKLQIDQRDDHIYQLENILSDNKQLKKIIRNQTKQDSLNKKLYKTYEDEIIIELPAIPEGEELGVGHGINKTNLNQNLKLESLEAIGNGVTTIIFNYPKNKNKVIGITLDTKKIDWLEANKDLFDYNYIMQTDYNRGNKAHVYTMVKIKQFFEERDLPANKMNLIYSEVIVPFFYLVDKKGQVMVKDIDWIIKYMDDQELISILKKVQKVYKPDDILDLHGGQWGMNSGKILLFDPVIDERIFSKIGNNNVKGWVLAVKHSFQDFFRNSKNKERQKIIKLLKK